MTVKKKTLTTSEAPMRWPEPYTKDSDYLPVATITVCGAYATPTGMWGLGPMGSRMTYPFGSHVRFLHSSSTRAGRASWASMASLRDPE